MSFVVKNTTKFGFLDLIAPHSCRGCGQLGAVVCECCKNDILQSQRRICPLCKNYIDIDDKKCLNCDLPCAEIFAACRREGWLGHLIGEYKMHSVRAAKTPLIDILDGALQQSSIVSSGKPVVVVPLPTIRKHVRERGLDHTAEIAKTLARRHGYSMQRMLGRARDSVQVGSSKTARKVQAKSAYELLLPVQDEVCYLLIDDIWTTGASMLAAINLLAEAGVARQQIFGAVIALSK